MYGDYEQVNGAVVNSLERENERLRSTLRKSLEFVSKFTSGNTIQRDVRAIAVRSGPTIAQEATFLRDQINDAMNGANTEVSGGVSRPLD